MIKSYYQDEWVTIYHGDCRELLPTLGKVDLVLTSPPYDNLRDYGGYSFDFNVISPMLYEGVVDGGIVVWVVGDSTTNGSESGTSFKQALGFMGLGFNLHDTMIYKKLNYTPLTHNRYEQEYEYMFCFSKGKPKTFNPIKVPSKYAGQETWGKPSYYKTTDGALTEKPRKVIGDTKIRGNVFEYRTGSTQTGNIKHPAMFPEQLAKDQITSWTNQGGFVLDPFLGSGTTALACRKLNRKCIGIEIEEEYCEIAAKRCSQSVMRLEI